MAAVDRWTDELIAMQEAFVWLVPEKALAVTLVEEAGLLTDFIDFGEPVYLRIKRILLEATKRNMMIPLLTVLTRWYPENQELKDAILFWAAGEDRKAAANLIMKAARQIPDPVAVAKVTRIGGEVKEVEVAVSIPTIVVDDPAVLVPPSTSALPTTPAPPNVPYRSEHTCSSRDSSCFQRHPQHSRIFLQRCFGRAGAGGLVLDEEDPERP